MDLYDQDLPKSSNATIVRSELVSQLAETHASLSAKDVDYAVRCLLHFLADSLSKGHRIEIRGFGSFSLHHRKERIASHPKTGNAIFLPAKSIPYFKPGKAVRDAVNNSAESNLPKLS